MKVKIIDIKEISKLPQVPGVYLFYGEKRQLFYIGKASNLKKRVKDHFQSPIYKDNLFIKDVKKIEYIPLDSEIEALILESQLIKKKKPKFNILLRDDKNYFFVGITKEDWPRVFITHQPFKVQQKGKNSNSKVLVNYIGPFTDGRALKETLKLLRKVFPYRSCKTMPSHPCFWYQLERCPAPCLFKKELENNPQLKKQIKKRKIEYQKNIKNLKDILLGKKTSLLKDLKKEMKRLSNNLNFEEANVLLQKIKNLEIIFSHRALVNKWQTEEEKTKIDVGALLKKTFNLKKIPKRIEGYDISNLGEKEMVGSLVVFSYKNKKYIPNKKEYRHFKIKKTKKQSDVDCLKEVLERRFNHPEWKMPDLIYIDGGKTQLNAAKKILEKYKKTQIPIIALAKKSKIVYNINFNIPLDKLPQEVKILVLNLKDESHRFALLYHRKKRSQTMFIN